MNRQGGSLWAITSFFNPARFQRRLTNYRQFRAALQVPLATIELGFTGGWELGPADADLYIRIGHGDLLWQKERLLNVIVSRLPPDCEYIVWLDCDVLFGNSDWPLQLVSALRQSPLVQPFTSVRHLSRDGSQDPAGLIAESVASKVCSGTSIEDALGRVTDRASGAPSPGMVWAARRDLLEAHGIYDACIIGGGDTALACAAYGVPEIAVRLHSMNEFQRTRYLHWALPFHREVRGGVRPLAGEIRHLWHGEIADRRAKDRHAGLAEFGFNPFEDIVVGDEGAWRWAGRKDSLHTYVRDYFHRRNEDG